MLKPIILIILACIYYVTGFLNNVFMFKKNFIKKKGKNSK